jgi:hypothetical protein
MATGIKVRQEANDHLHRRLLISRVTPSFGRLAIRGVRVSTPMNKAYLPPNPGRFSRLAAASGSSPISLFPYPSRWPVACCSGICWGACAGRSPPDFRMVRVEPPDIAILDRLRRGVFWGYAKSDAGCQRTQTGDRAKFGSCRELRTVARQFPSSSASARA